MCEKWFQLVVAWQVFKKPVQKNNSSIKEQIADQTPSIPPPQKMLKKIFFK